MARLSPGRSPRNFGQETDNTAKYERTGALETLSLARFRARLLDEVVRLRPDRVLDAGCGEGHVTSWLVQALGDVPISAVDGRRDALVNARGRNPSVEHLEADVSELPFGDDAFDLVLCAEVLEHVPEPARVLRELGRVSGRHLLITVPHEPFFRAGNLARGRYLARLGSTPGHLWTWGRKGLLEAVGAELDTLRWFSAFPWQGVVARPRP